MKKFIVVILLISGFNICFGQSEQEICFTRGKDVISSYFEQGVRVSIQLDTICYVKMFNELSLYKSLDKRYPYLFIYEDKYKEVHYFFVRQDDIYIGKDKIEINLYDDSNMQMSISKIVNNFIFYFNLNY